MSAEDRRQPGDDAALAAEVPPTAPPWATGLDVLALALLALALYVALAGRAVLLRHAQFVLPSSQVWLFACAAVLAIRHTACPRPGIGRTLADWGRRLDTRPHAAAAVRAFAFTRPAVFLVAYFAVVTMGFPPRPVGFTLSTDPLGNLPARFDAGWYGGIALSGYDRDRQIQRQRNTAFFPALPALMRPVGSFLGARTPTLPRDKRLLRMLWAGVLVSLVAFAWALYYVSHLAGRFGGPQAIAHAPLLLASYPFAVFYNAPYTEALFLLGCVGAFYHFHQGDWVRASCWGLLVGFSRPNGCLVSIPLAVLALQQVLPAVRAGGGVSTLQVWLKPLGVRLLVASMPGVAMLAFTAYLYNLTGVWFIWARLHGAWGRTWSTRPLQQGWEWLTTEGIMGVFEGVPYDSMNTLAGLFALGMTWHVFRRLGPAYGTFVLVNLLPPVFAGGALSIGRVTSTLFPIFIALAMVVPGRSLPAWVAGFALLQGFVAAIFFTWRDLF